MEGMYLLQEYLQVECKMMYCQDCTDMASQAPEMLQHLESEGTPIMMGAGMYAYTLVGLCFDQLTGEARGEAHRVHRVIYSRDGRR